MSQPSLLDQLTRPRKALSVSELTAQIKTLVEGRFLDVWVQGEISNFVRHSSGHWYFTLKDQTASIQCASFRMQNRLIRFSPQDGLTVRARGRLAVYEPRGAYQLQIEFLEPVGAGALQVAFEQLKAKLDAEGLFDQGRKRNLPILPRRIGVVTSPDGAAVRDILRIVKRRNEAIHILVAPVRVQGDGAAREIVEAIEALNLLGSVDVIIVGRGGGSIEDLWCFNEEIVARAIYTSRVPVISAVGHETDFTIADFVADLRASTPSAAAEMVAAAREEMYARMKGLTGRMAAAARYRLMALRNRLSTLRSSRAFEAVPRRIKSTSQRLDDGVYSMERLLGNRIRKRRVQLRSVTERLREADVRRALGARARRLALLRSRLERAGASITPREREKLSVAAMGLESLSPLAVLGRGYAIAFNEMGAIVKRAADVAEGDRLRVRVDEGEIGCRVINGGAAPGDPRRQESPRPTRITNGQESLWNEDRRKD
jgi:exodeoxyribonuclease VII large subunit